jgi:hypothetical protein
MRRDVIARRRWTPGPGDGRVHAVPWPGRRLGLRVNGLGTVGCDPSAGKGRRAITLRRAQPSGETSFLSTRLGMAPLPAAEFSASPAAEASHLAEYRLAPRLGSWFTTNGLMPGHRVGRQKTVRS